MDKNQREILKYLQSNAVGSKNAKTADKIQKQLATQGITIDSGRTQEIIRNLIKDMVITNDELIGSSNKGYYIITNKNDAKTTYDDLINRSTENLNRANKIKSLWNSSPSGTNDKI